MKMKKIVLIIAFMAMSLVGCGQKNEGKAFETREPNRGIRRTVVETAAMGDILEFEVNRQMLIETVEEEWYEAGLTRIAANRLIDLISSVQYDPRGWDSLESFEVEFVNILVDDRFYPEYYRDMTFNDICVAELT